MRMDAFMRRCLLYHMLYAALAASLSGCSFCLNRPVTFLVRDAETKRPIEGAEIRTFSFNPVLVTGVSLTGWGPTNGKTDRDGKVTLVFDPYKKLFFMDASAEGYRPERSRSGNWITERITPRRQFEWKNDFVLDMYPETAGLVEPAPDNDDRDRPLTRAD
jgi:hypothetical protein